MPSMTKIVKNISLNYKARGNFRNPICISGSHIFTKNYF